VAAMRDWSRLTAGPPRSYEWAPATGRALGRLGPGQVLWERDHPRWPSAGTVVHHFGSFGAGLEAAGFPVPPRSELPAHEAAPAARRPASRGRSTKAIAAELGVAWATADGYLRSGDRPLCGRPKGEAHESDRPLLPRAPAGGAAARPGRDRRAGARLAARDGLHTPDRRLEAGGHPKWDASSHAGREARPSPGRSVAAGRAPSPRRASSPPASGLSGRTNKSSPRSRTGPTPTETPRPSAPNRLAATGKRPIC
jgi:hypothetical protein